MSQIIITEPYGRRADTEAITIERAIMLRAMRRRRVAKRMYKRLPLFAVEEMQGEFPGYDWDGYVEDITRKTRKGKSFRRPKQRAFDWKQLYKEVPEFVTKCVVRTKTLAVIRGKTSNGIEFTMHIRSHWFDGSGNRRLETGKLIELLKGKLSDLMKHEAVNTFYSNNTLLTHDGHLDLVKKND